MELWCNDLAGGILLQEPYQTGASYQQQEGKTAQTAPNRFVNLTYLSQSTKGGIGLQDQRSYNPNLGGSPLHPLLSPPPAVQSPGVHPTFSRGLTMPSLNAQEAYAAAMAGFDTHKVAGHGTLKRMQQQAPLSPGMQHGKMSSDKSAVQQYSPVHLQKSHTDGHLMLRTRDNGSGESNEIEQMKMGGGATNSSSVDNGIEKTMIKLKHESPVSHPLLGYTVDQPESLLKDGSTDSGK